MFHLPIKITMTALATGLAQCAPAAPAAGIQPATTRPEAIADSPDPVNDLLDRLETSTGDLRDFEAKINYSKWDNVLQRDELRTGSVIYQVKPDGTKRFAILLERLIVGRRARDQRKHYVFDGSWFVEVDFEAKLFIKRQVVPPGEQFDPLKLGEGPFPLPVGQPADEVLARFDVKRLDRPQDATLAGRLGERVVDGLLLRSKPDTPQADEFVEAEIFYDRETLLPVGIGVAEANGDRKTVVLRDLKRNGGVDEAVLNIEEPDAREGWRIDIRPWRE
jgi:hypothetical protein